MQLLGSVCGFGGSIIITIVVKLSSFGKNLGGFFPIFFCLGLFNFTTKLFRAIFKQSPFSARRSFCPKHKPGCFIQFIFHQHFSTTAQ